MKKFKWKEKNVDKQGNRASLKFGDYQEFSNFSLDDCNVEHPGQLSDLQKQTES